MTLYRTVEVTPGVRLEPGPYGRRAELVVDAANVARGQARYELDEAALERLADATAEARE